VLSNTPASWTHSEVTKKMKCCEYVPWSSLVEGEEIEWAGMEKVEESTFGGIQAACTMHAPFHTGYKG
jgi:hypothetical protein